jgi:hypothetical protein
MFRNIFGIIILALLLSNCSSSNHASKSTKNGSNVSDSKYKNKNPLAKNIPLKFDGSMALNIDGIGHIDVYKNHLSVTIEKAMFQLNPNCNNDDYFIEKISLGIGKYINPLNKSWTLKNKGTATLVGKKIESLSEGYTLKDLNFTIPYNDKSDLEDAWIVVRVDHNPKACIYAHSNNHEQDFGLPSEKSKRIDYSKFSEEELDEKQKAFSLKLNHLMFQDYIDYAEDKKISFSNAKMTSDEIKSLWKTDPELIFYRKQLEFSAADLTKFKKENDPNYNINLKKYHKKEISLDEYYKTHRATYNKLKTEFPEEFPELLETSMTHHKEMWIATLKYLLEDSKKKEKIYPLNWLTDKQIKALKQTSLIKKIDKELNSIENEIIKRI